MFSVMVVYIGMSVSDISLPKSQPQPVQSIHLVITALTRSDISVWEEIMCWNLPLSSNFWIQLRLPLCCAPANTQRLWGWLSGTKLQCSYRESKPSHSGMSHSWLSNGGNRTFKGKAFISSVHNETWNKTYALCTYKCSSKDKKKKYFILPKLMVCECEKLPLGLAPPIISIVPFPSSSEGINVHVWPTLTPGALPLGIKEYLSIAKKS